MRGWARRIAVAALALVALVFATSGAPGPALADSREFAGRVEEVSGEGVVVRNRSGDERRFVRTKQTQVVGKRSSWKDLRGGDSVIVTWSLDDDPVECRRIDVLSTAAGR